MFVKSEYFSAYPNLLKSDADKILGIQNRPEIILSNNGYIDFKNNERYHSISAYGRINVLAAKMPKFYKNNLSSSLLSKI